MQHQGELHRLNIAVRYRYVEGIKDGDYPDYRWLMNDIQRFLTGYPSDSDYWEIVNKKLTQMLLQEYPALASVTCVIGVPPTRTLPHMRSSIVTRFRPAQSRGSEGARESGGARQPGAVQR